MDKSLSSKKELSEGIIHTSEMKELNFEGEPMWKSKDSGTGGVINNKKSIGVTAPVFQQRQGTVFPG